MKERQTQQWRWKVSRSSTRGRRNIRRWNFDGRSGRSWSSPGVTAVASDMARLTAAPAEAIHGTGLAACTKPGNRNEQRVGRPGCPSSGSPSPGDCHRRARGRDRGSCGRLNELPQTGGKETTDSTIEHFGGEVPEVLQTGFGLNPNHTKSHVTVGDAVGNSSVTVSWRLVRQTYGTIAEELHSWELLLIHWT